MAKVLHFGAVVVCLFAPNVFAQDDPLPPNTVPCEAFKKNPNGDWIVQADVSFDAAGLSEKIHDNQFGELYPQWPKPVQAN
jgi:hypothetical protein